MSASPKKAKRFPLPKRFAAALSDEAYARLRALNAAHGYGNNYLLTIILENFDEIVDEAAFDRVMTHFKNEYGAPKTS